MEKKEIKKLFKTYMKAIGFTCKGNYSYKMIDDDYLVGVWLEHSSYKKTYRVLYGVNYLPDERGLPFNRWCDWHANFYFTTDISDDLRKYPIEDIHGRFGKALTQDFEYECRTAEDFDFAMNINVEKRLTPVFDKSYVLDIYRNDWIYFRGVPHVTVRKLCGLLGIDAEKAIEVRDSWLTKYP